MRDIAIQTHAPRADVRLSRAQRRAFGKILLLCAAIIGAILISALVGPQNPEAPLIQGSSGTVAQAIG